MYYGYILRSLKTRRFYSGHTEDLPNRLSEHNAGESKSTRSGIPWKIVFTKEFNTRAAAMQWEQQVKTRGIQRYLEDLRKTSG